MKLRYVLAALFCLMASVAHAEDAFDRVMRTKTLNCGYIVVPPYIIKDVNTGKMGGINYDMLEAMGKYLGLKINWAAEIGASDVSAALSSNKIDVMCQTMWPSAARFTGMTFANRPQFYSAIYAVTRADDHRFDGDLSKADKPDITGVGFEGDFSADMLNEKLPHSKHFLLSGSAGLSDYIMQITTRKADILFMDKGSVEDFSRANPGKIVLVKGLGPVRLFGEHLTVKLGEYRLRDILDMATLQLVNDGVFAKLVAKYRKEYKTEIYGSKGDIDR